MHHLGIRREDKNQWERRAPLTPTHVAELINEHGLSIAVQPSLNRIFPDDEYHAAGAAPQEDLSDCRVLLCVKEVPPHLLIPAKPYFCFPHVTKGQANNLPLLRRILATRCTLIDYERTQPSSAALASIGMDSTILRRMPPLLTIAPRATAHARFVRLHNSRPTLVLDSAPRTPSLLLIAYRQDDDFLLPSHAKGPFFSQTKSENEQLLT